MPKKFRFYKQFDLMDCGPTCLRMVAKHYGRIYSREYLREISHITKEGVSLRGISDAAEIIGLNTLGVQVGLSELKRDIPLPCIVPWRQRHFIVVYHTDKTSVYVADPAHGLLRYQDNEFLNGWAGSAADNSEAAMVLVLEPSPDFDKQNTEQDQQPAGSLKLFRFLLPYFKRHRRLLLQLVFGLIAGSLVQLILPFLAQAVVDKGVNYRDLKFLYVILFAQLVLFLSQLLVQLIRDRLLLFVTGRLNIRLISDFLYKLMKLPVSFFERKNVGDLVQRVQDHDRIQSFLSSTSLNTLFSFVNFIVFSFILIYYSPFIFVLFVTGAVLYISWSLFFLRKRRELDYKKFDELSLNQSSIIQIINSIQEIKINNSQKRRRWEWESIQMRLFKTSMRSLTLAQFQNTGSGFINELKNILITFFAAKLVINGQITLGEMVSIQYIIAQLNAPIANLINFMQSGQDAKLSLERLAEIHGRTDEDAQTDTERELPGKGNLVIQNLWFSYSGGKGKNVLSDVCFTAEEGKVTAIVGESGSGKTTLLKLLLKFYPVSQGGIMVDTTKLDSINTDFWRSRCGAVMQDGYIFADSILRNITESEPSDHVNKTRLYEAAKVANIHNFIESLPSGYHTKLGPAGISLSGGQKQRILIARAVYKSPGYLFFDEATSALDTINEKIIMENLYSYFAKRTVIIVAHRLSTVKNADKIVVLKEGRVVEQGTHKGLVEKEGDYLRLVRNQLELGG